MQQHYDAAHTFYLGGDVDDAAAEYSAFLAEAFHGLANAYSKAKDFSRASQLFGEAARFGPEDNGIRLDAARSLLQQGKYSEARDLAQKVRQSGLDDAKTQFLLGQILYAQGHYKDARAPLEAAVVAAPSFDVGYLLGVTYIKLGDYTRALLLFSDIVQGLGDSAPIHLLLARAYAKGGDEGLENAVAELKRAIALDTTLPQAHYLLAVAYLTRDGEPAFPSMIPELRAELENAPEDPNTHYLLGYIAFKQHDTNTAETELMRSAAAAPENPDTWVYLGEVYSDQGRDDQAETALRRAITSSSHAGPDDFLIPRAHYMLGRILLNKGQAEEGKRELVTSKELRDRLSGRDQAASDSGQDDKVHGSAKLNEDSGVLVPDGSASPSPELRKQAETLNDGLRLSISDAYNNLGVIAAGKKNFADAVNDFEQAGQWNLSLATLDRNWGMAAFYDDQYSRAIQPLERHLAKQPDDQRARAVLGLSYFGTENYAKVLETLKPIASALDDPGVAYAYAVSLVKTGDDAEGIKRLQSLAAKKTDSAELHTLIGQALADTKDYISADQEFRKSLALDPNQSQTLFDDGLALLRTGQPGEAVEQFRKSLNLKPDDIRTKYHLAFSLLSLEKNDEASVLLKEVVHQDPAYVDAYYELGKLQLAQGDAKSAIANLETGVKLGPDRDYIHYQLAMAYRKDARTADAQRELKVYKDLKDRHRGRSVAQ